MPQQPCRKCGHDTKAKYFVCDPCKDLIVKAWTEKDEREGRQRSPSRLLASELAGAGTRGAAAFESSDVEFPSPERNLHRRFNRLYFIMDHGRKWTTSTRRIAANLLHGLNLALSDLVDAPEFHESEPELEGWDRA